MLDMIALADRLGLVRRRPNYVALPALNLAYGRVPKVANSTIKKRLSKLIGAPDGQRVNSDAHWRDGSIIGAKFLNEAELDARMPGAFVFSFVRNPFARVLSCYIRKVERRRELPDALKRQGFEQGMSFEAFLEHAEAIPDRRIDTHLRSAACILAWRGRVRADFVGRLEAFKADWARLRAQVSSHSGVDIGATPEHKRTRPPRGSDRSLSQYYTDPGMAARVRRRYREDFERWYPNETEIV